MFGGYVSFALMQRSELCHSIRKDQDMEMQQHRRSRGHRCCLEPASRGALASVPHGLHQVQLASQLAAPGPMCAFAEGWAGTSEKAAGRVSLRLDQSKPE